MAKLGAGTAVQEAAWEVDDTLFIPAVADGICNAVVFWNEADMGAGYTLTSFEPQSSTPQSPCESHTLGSIPKAPSSPSGGDFSFNKKMEARAVLDGVDIIGADDESSELEKGVQATGVCVRALASSWPQGVQYLDGIHVKKVRALTQWLHSHSNQPGPTYSCVAHESEEAALGDSFFGLKD